MCPFFQSGLEPLDFMFEGVYGWRNLTKIPLAGDLFQAKCGLEGRLCREVSHGAFQSVGEALKVMTLQLVNGAVNGLHLFGKVV